MNVIQLRKKRPEPRLIRDIRLMWGDVDWFMVITGAVLYVAAVVVIVFGMLAIASVVSPADLERVLAVIGGAL